MNNLIIKKFSDYRDKFASKATHLFAQLLPDKHTSLRDKTMLRILVVAAGTFPGFKPLMQRLMQVAPQLTKIHFTLVEPVQKYTNIFMENYAQDFKADFLIVNKGIDEFLKNHTGSAFDMVYFEHPETMTLPIIYAKLGWKKFRRVLTLRKSLPQLAQILEPNALVLASCMSKHELKQLNSLLIFSLNIAPQLSVSRNPLHYFYGGPFSVGLLGNLCDTALDNLSQKMRVIERSDNLLFVFLLLSFAIYLWKFLDPAHAGLRIIAVLLMGAQFFLHRPGMNGLVIKIGLIAILGLLVL